jgi:hypothetical protein
VGIGTRQLGAECRDDFVQLDGQDGAD